VLTANSDSDETSNLSRYDDGPDWARTLMVGLAGAACVGAAVGILFWLGWWPHRSGGLDAVAALLLLGGTTLVLVVAPHRSSLAWMGLLVVAVAVAGVVYAIGVLSRMDGCGDCPPWVNEQDKPSVNVPAGQPVPPISGAAQTTTTSATVTAAANQPEIGASVGDLDAEVRWPVGVAANHGWLFLSSQRRDAPIYEDQECPGASQVTVVGAVGVRQTIVVPGDIVNRVEIGPGDWGYAAVSCASNSWVVPLRVVDRSIEVVAGTATGEPQIYEAGLVRSQLSFEPVASVWRSPTTITIGGQRGSDLELLDLTTGDRVLLELRGVEAPLPDGRFNVVLASSVEPQRAYYVGPDRSCQAGSPDVFPMPHVVSAGDDRAVAVDAGHTFRGLAQLVFGPQNQVAWFNRCSQVGSIWTATVDPVTGEFESITEVMDQRWLSDNAWSSGGFVFGLRSISFDEQGSLVAWAHTHQGLEAARSTRDDQGLHWFSPPTVVVEVDPGPPGPVRAPQVLGTAQPSDVEISQLASGRAAGTADRAGLVFYGLDTYEAEVGVEGCDDATSPVFGFGASTVPERVAVVPGTRLTKFQVDWQGRLVAVSTCGETVYVSVGEFDMVSRTITAGTLRVWKIDKPQTQPDVQVTGDIRWGPHLLDQESGTWQVVRAAGEVLVEKGQSDSGRYRYFAESGFRGDETGPIDSILRLMVEDTSTGVIRLATDSPLGAEAHRLIFGPSDEVAWIVGNELSAAAFLGRVDWSTGEIIEAERLMPDLEPYWAYPKSGSGRPGPDAIAFEPDGTLRAWAYTFGSEETRSSETWIVDTLTFSFDD